MDSGNSGSMQSSSCGEEEFDSRPDSISSFFSPQNQPPHQQQQPLFDPLSTYLDVFSRPTTNPTHHHHHQLSWPPPQISLAGAAQPPTFLFNPSPSLPNLGAPTTTTTISTAAPTTTNVSPVVNNEQNAMRASTTGASASSSHQAHQANQDPGPNPALGSTRNPKKRSRASRRAPTTVLTTDTSNFRAMVQEFTGIPAPPFSSSASLPFPHRTRLDLFGGGAGAPSYLLRPFAHKLQPPAPPPPMAPSQPTFLSHHVHHHSNDNIISTSSSSSSVGVAPPLHVMNVSNAPNSSSNNSNYQLPSELGLLHKPQNVVLNMHSSSSGAITTTSTASTAYDDPQQQQQHHPMTMLSFQSLLQSQPPLPSSSKPNSSSDHLFGGLKMGSSVMEELGHGYEDHQVGHLRGFNASSAAAAVASTSQIVTSSSGGCHAKGSDQSVPSRGEGMVDSWICPNSD